MPEPPKPPPLPEPFHGGDTPRSGTPTLVGLRRPVLVPPPPRAVVPELAPAPARRPSPRPPAPPPEPAPPRPSARLGRALDGIAVASALLCAILPRTPWVRGLAGVTLLLLIWRAVVAWRTPRPG